MTGSLLVLSAWAVVGSAVTLLAAAFRTGPRTSAPAGATAAEPS